MHNLIRENWHEKPILSKKSFLWMVKLHLLTKVSLLIDIKLKYWYLSSIHQYLDIKNSIIWAKKFLITFLLS